MSKFTDYQLMIFEKEKIECDDVLELLGDYQDQELPLSLRARVASHLAQCPHCFEVERGYRMVVDLARELKEPPMPEGVRRRLREALNRRLGLRL
ncbi:MAG: hypothetical protein GX589_04725 [Deltaproteobacteria bacterium]|nr:hypothetical protein [Deltaproteobacteria bacterium]